MKISFKCGAFACSDVNVSTGPEINKACGNISPLGAMPVLLLILVITSGSVGGGEKIQFSHDSALCGEPFELAIRSRTDLGRIYFTTNGAIPTAGSLRYEKPLRIATTTVVRAAAENGAATSVESRTFIFPGEVTRQTGEGFPKTWGVNHGKPVPADYEMDPKIVGNPEYRDLIVPALESLPSLSIVMRPEDLFGAETGIYAHAQDTGPETERPASFNVLAGKGQGFAVNGGIRVQGGLNRLPEESPKHSFRLTFKKKFGDRSLRFPLFRAEEEFETMILRGGNNNSWLHWSGEERRRADFIRDQWMRESYGEMGNASARGLFVHLYLNGLYWGIYNLCERPSAPFAAAHFGGKARDYDSRNADKILEGDGATWNELFKLVNGGSMDSRRYAAVSELVDVGAFCDFMIVNLYGANADWDRSSNWYAARRREPAGKFRFFVWDGERTLEKLEDNTIAFDDDQSPARLFQKLRVNREFQMAFRERVQRHLFGEGALTPTRAGERFRAWAAKLDRAIIAESARWGDYRRDVHPYKTGPYELYTRNQHWRPEIDRLLNDYFPKRTAIVIEQFRSAELYPKSE